MAVANQGRNASYVALTSSLAGDNIIYSGSAGEVATLLGYSLSSPGGQSYVTWQSNTTDVGGELGIASGTTISNESDWGLLETTSGENLVLNVSGDTVKGHIIFFLSK